MMRTRRRTRGSLLWTAKVTSAGFAGVLGILPTDKHLDTSMTEPPESHGQTDAVLRDIASMNEVLSRVPRRELFAPAEFWETLGRKHLRLIEQAGFENFKRTINFEYNQWGVHSLRDPKIRNLLRRLIERRHVPFSLFRIRPHAREWEHVRWPDVIAQNTGAALSTMDSRHSRWRALIHALYVGLLWEYAEAVDDLHLLSTLQEPMIGSPLPITRDGGLITQDLAMSAIELNKVARHVDLQSVERVAEIGAGYGRFAYVVIGHLPGVHYDIFDIPPALAVTRHYLERVFGEDRVAAKWRDDTVVATSAINTYLPHQMQEMPDDYYDLVVNISSFDEMSRAQVEHYFAMIEKKARGWLYVKGHSANRGGERVGLAGFPYRSHWTLVHQARDPFVDTFEERIYRLAGAAG